MNLAHIRIPKSGSTTIANNLDQIRNQHPCLSRVHFSTAYFEGHGHSHDYIGMVRDPIQQYISAYYYIKNIRAQNVVAEGNRKNVLPELAAVVDATNSLNDYLLNAPINDFAVRYFGVIQPSDFFFIGTVNEMEASLAVLGAMAGFSPINVWSNKNPARPQTLQPYWVPNDIAQQFMARNELEYEMYFKGLEKFNQLKGQYL